MSNKDYDYRIVDDRAVGKTLPISVALAIPFEEHLFKEELVYKNIYINIRTAFRAYHGSFSKEKRPGKAKLIEGFLEELGNVKPLISQLGYQLVVYYPLYNKPKSFFKDAVVVKAETSVARIYADIENDALSIAHREGLVDLVCNYRIKGMEGKTAIFTHIPMDLLSAPNFGSLELIETNTGTIKTMREWNTKLGVNPKYVKRIPFNILMMQLFGDKSKLFKSNSDNKLKKAILELAEEKKWTAMTTRAKIVADIGKLDKEFKEKALRMLNVKYS